VCQNLVPLVNIKIAGKWMFIPLKMVLIGIDPYPSKKHGRFIAVLIFLPWGCDHDIPWFYWGVDVWWFIFDHHWWRKVHVIIFARFLLGNCFFEFWCASVFLGSENLRSCFSFEVWTTHLMDYPRHSWPWQNWGALDDAVAQRGFMSRETWWSNSGVCTG